MSWKIMAEQDDGDFNEAKVVDALIREGFYDIEITQTQEQE